MVRRLGSLASSAVDEAERGSRRHRGRTQEEVDPQPHLLVEGAIAVVPPAVQPGLFVLSAEQIDKAERFDLTQRLPLGRGDMGPRLRVVGIPHVAIIGTDVEIAAHQHRLGGITCCIEVGPETTKPVELVPVVIVIHFATVGYVHRGHPQPATGSRQDSCLLIGLRTITEVGERVRDTNLGQDGYPVPSSLAVVHALVAQRRVVVMGELLVRHLRFLHQQDIGAGIGQPLVNPLHTGIEAVDVPGDHTHADESSDGRGERAASSVATVSTPQTIDAVLFDFGGVITTSPFEAFNRYEAELGIPLDTIRTINATNPDDNAWARMERNEVTVEEFSRLFEDEASAVGHQLSGTAVLGCLSGDVRPQMVRALDILAARVRIGCITNNMRQGHGAGMARTPEQADRVADAMSRFEVVIESSKVGLRKPDPRIYELACREMGIHASRTAYLDDLGVNCKPARALGMATIKVGDPDVALDELEQIVGFALR